VEAVVAGLLWAGVVLLQAVQQVLVLVLRRGRVQVWVRVLLGVLVPLLTSASPTPWLGFGAATQWHSGRSL
jgi:hypothetical protein